ncbi:hypothetical protein ACFQYP_39365 [Nonomuraea antimicrobica]
MGKGWPGDHSATGEVVVRDIAARIGLPAPDVETLATVVRHHLLLPETATRRDLSDPVTIEKVAATVGSREVLELLAALAVADGTATGPAAWNAWKAGLVADLVRRVRSVLTGSPPQAADPVARAGRAGPARRRGRPGQRGSGHGRRPRPGGPAVERRRGAGRPPARRALGLGRVRGVHGGDRVLGHPRVRLPSRPRDAGVRSASRPCWTS